MGLVIQQHAGLIGGHAIRGREFGLELPFGQGMAGGGGQLTDFHHHLVRQLPQLGLGHHPPGIHPARQDRKRIERGVPHQLAPSFGENVVRLLAGDVGCGEQRRQTSGMHRPPPGPPPQGQMTVAEMGDDPRSRATQANKGQGADDLVVGKGPGHRGLDVDAILQQDDDRLRPHRRTDDGCGIDGRQHLEGDQQIVRRIERLLHAPPNPDRTKMALSLLNALDGKAVGNDGIMIGAADGGNRGPGLGQLGRIIPPHGPGANGQDGRGCGGFFHFQSLFQWNKEWIHG